MRNWFLPISGAVVAACLSVIAFYAGADPPASSHPGGGFSRYSAQPITFCGEQGNATAHYGGPHLTSILHTEAAFEVITLGVAACNTLGDGTIGDVDNDISPDVGYVVTGMFCRLSATPATGTTVLTFMDDTVDTAITCSVAAGGPIECASAAGIVADIASNSQVAVKVLAAGDDSGDDFKCMVFVSWE